MSNTPETQSTESNENLPSQRNFLSAAIRGEHGLPETFWGWGVVGSILLILFISAAINISEADAVLVGSLLVFQSYSTFVAISTWRASSRAQGSSSWPVITKLIVLAWYALLLLAFLYLMAVFSSEYPNH